MWDSASAVMKQCDDDLHIAVLQVFLMMRLQTPQRIRTWPSQSRNPSTQEKKILKEKLAGCKKLESMNTVTRQECIRYKNDGKNSAQCVS